MLHPIQIQCIINLNECIVHDLLDQALVLLSNEFLDRFRLNPIITSHASRVRHEVDDLFGRNVSYSSIGILNLDESIAVVLQYNERSPVANNILLALGRLLHLQQYQISWLEIILRD